MKKIRFSVLIPNYGNSPYLYECLDSILNQRKDENFEYEVIVYDQSEKAVFNEINQRAIAKYGDKINLIHSNIKGLLKARHSLMAKSNGDYIVFVDSDDVVDNDYLLLLSKTISINNFPDLVINKLKKVYENGKVVINNYKEHVNNIDDFKDYLAFTDKFNSVCIKVFKKSLYNIDDYNLFDFAIGEDKIFSLPIVKKSQTCVFTNICSYNYRIDSNSMIHRQTPKEILQNIFLLDYLDIEITQLNKKQATIYLSNLLLKTLYFVNNRSSFEKEEFEKYFNIIEKRIFLLKRKHKIVFAPKELFLYFIIKFRTR